MAAPRNHVLTLAAAVLNILEPTGKAGHASQANADETEKGTDEAVAETLALLSFTLSSPSMLEEDAYICMELPSLRISVMVRRWQNGQSMGCGWSLSMLRGTTVAG